MGWDGLLAPCPLLRTLTLYPAELRARKAKSRTYPAWRLPSQAVVCSKCAEWAMRDAQCGASPRPGLALVVIADACVAFGSGAWPPHRWPVFLPGAVAGGAARSS